MGTAIEWTNESWNPLTGCTRVTRGCDHCYAFALHDMRHEVYKRDGGKYPNNGKPMPVQYARPFTDIQLIPERLEQPLHIKTPKMFFVNSMSDLFHSQVPDDYIFQVFDVMRRANWHTFQILTKRSGRLRRLGQLIDWPDNVWMGVSIEHDNLTRRADALRECAAAVRFLSCEPLLGPLPSLDLTGLHWVITGGESGTGARACDPEWVREIRDRCHDARVAFFHKQWGGRNPKAGGRLLDGQTWDQFPMVRGCGAGACLNLASSRLLARGYRVCEECAASMSAMNSDNAEAFQERERENMYYKEDTTGGETEEKSFVGQRCHVERNGFGTIVAINPFGTQVKVHLDGGRTCWFVLALDVELLEKIEKGEVNE